MGLGDLYPDRMTDSVYGLDWEKLTGRYRGVIFDIDDTRSGPSHHAGIK